MLSYYVIVTFGTVHGICSTSSKKKKNPSPVHAIDVDYNKRR
jgi:hypothetical protein